MSNPQDLTQLTREELGELAWQLKGTPEVQPIYAEMSRRPAKNVIKPDDPDWENKVRALIARKLGQSVSASQPHAQEN
jgi:hypothetical protein